jgi:hypothetical protein
MTTKSRSELLASDYNLLRKMARVMSKKLKLPPRGPQSGNAAWKATMVKHQWKRGHAGARKCSAIAKWTALPCGKVAMRHSSFCYTHGGRMVQVAQKLQEAKRAKAAEDKGGKQLTRRWKEAGKAGRSEGWGGSSL